MNLNTTDNNCGKHLVSLTDTGEQVTKIDYQNLSKIANTPIAELAKNNPALLIFPQVLGAHDDGIEEQEIFNLHGDSEKLENVLLKTGNLMGFIGIGGTQLKITSRFSSDDKSDYFLHYMLQKVFSINLFDWEHSTSNDGQLDLLMFAFPLLLKKALAQGIFRQYQTFNRNDANVKGVIDVSRHIRQNIPFGGKIAYKSRERTFDNPLTELIRHTIEYIRTKAFVKDILTNDPETKICVQEITEATQSYDIHNREKVIAQNLKPITHPYYTVYKPLQNLCLSILRHKKIGYRNSKNKAYGILFDGAWLWEEYLAKILKEQGFEHPKNKTHSGGIQMFKNKNLDEGIDKNFRRIYPDFYKPGTCILDAKYKQLDNGLFREDLYQVVTYMHTMAVKQGGFIFPSKNTDENDKNVFHYELAGYGGFVHSIKFRIPQIVNSKDDFIKNMQDEEKKLENHILSILEITQTPS